MTASPVHHISGFDLWHWRQQAQADAVQAAIPIAEVDWLLQTVAGLDRLALRLETYKTQPTVALHCSLTTLTDLWQQRLHQQVPVQYLAGTTPWRQFSLTVTPAVLIPRPETELIIDLAVAAAQASGDAAEPQHWADLGTGSGAIALGLAEAFPQATIHAVDTSAEALQVAQQNACQPGFADRIQFYQGHWFEPLSALQGQLSGMVSNPPYIPTALIADLQPEVARHEPRLALDGGADGLTCIRHLVATAPAYLKPGGIWLIEIMAGQSPAVLDLLRARGCYTNLQTHCDLAGLDRFVLAYHQ